LQALFTVRTPSAILEEVTKTRSSVTRSSSGDRRAVRFPTWPFKPWSAVIRVDGQRHGAAPSRPRRILHAVDRRRNPRQARLGWAESQHHGGWLGRVCLPLPSRGAAAERKPPRRRAETTARPRRSLRPAPSSATTWRLPAAARLRLARQAAGPWLHRQHRARCQPRTSLRARRRPRSPARMREGRTTRAARQSRRPSSRASPTPAASRPSTHAWRAARASRSRRMRHPVRAPGCP
jgi:hypothetical protein